MAKGMEVSLTTKNGLTARFEGEAKDVFENIGTFQEIFCHDTCGKCGGHDIRFVVRTNDDEDKFYELHCVTTVDKSGKPDPTSNFECKARLSFGAHKKGGTLFPKRKDSEGNWLNSNGWVKWNPNTKKEE